MLATCSSAATRSSDRARRTNAERSSHIYLPVVSPISSGVGKRTQNMPPMQRQQRPFLIMTIFFGQFGTFVIVKLRGRETEHSYSLGVGEIPCIYNTVIHHAIYTFKETFLATGCPINPHFVIRNLLLMSWVNVRNNLYTDKGKVGKLEHPRPDDERGVAYKY
jgi:hypothetical protein